MEKRKRKRGVYEDLSGLRFGKLTVIKMMPPTKAHSTKWLCACDCGGGTVAMSSNLKNSHSTSCGCITIQHGKDRTTHGQTKTKEYTAWVRMKARCYNKHNNRYKKYGEVGITVCDRWRNSFENFFEDMGICPENMNSIDRIENSLGYSPTNCRWANPLMQSNNRRNNKVISFNGETMTVSQWAEIKNINYHTLMDRLYKRGWSIEEALTSPIGKIGSNQFKTIM